MPLELNYYYGNEAEQYSFYRILKALFTDVRFQGVSIESKVLYGLLLDRMGLSAKNGWMDGDGRVYLYFTFPFSGAGSTVSGDVRLARPSHGKPVLAA